MSLFWCLLRQIPDAIPLGEPKEARKKHLEAVSALIKSVIASHEHQCNTRGSIKPRSKMTTVVTTPSPPTTLRPNVPAILSPSGRYPDPHHVHVQSDDLLCIGDYVSMLRLGSRFYGSAALKERRVTN